MNILFIDACVRQQSRTKVLADEVLGRLRGNVKCVKLAMEQIQPLNEERLEYRSALAAEGHFENRIFSYARDFASADTIVVAAPYWDLSYPSLLKVYIEQIMVNGLTFRYTEEGIPVSLCRAKHLIYVSTAGGPVIGENMGYSYMKLLADTFWKIQDVRLFQAENLDIIGADVEAILDQVVQEIHRSLPGTENIH